jgi:hypothetical protein
MKLQLLPRSVKFFTQQAIYLAMYISQKYILAIPSKIHFFTGKNPTLNYFESFKIHYTLFIIFSKNLFIYYSFSTFLTFSGVEN